MNKDKKTLIKYNKLDWDNREIMYIIFKNSGIVQKNNIKYQGTQRF